MMNKILFLVVYEYINHLKYIHCYTIHKYFVIYLCTCSWKILMKRNITIVYVENLLVH
jgi:hypothetical protein